MKIFNTKPSKNTKKIKKVILVIFVFLVLKTRNFQSSISIRGDDMEQPKPKILLVEDDQIDRIAFERFARQEDFPYAYVVAGSLAEARRVLHTETFAAAVLDYLLGDGSAFELFDELQGAPIILVTGVGNEEVAVQAMKTGAYDYLIKDADRYYLKTLALTVANAIKRKETETELQRYREHLEKLVEQRTIELRAEIKEHQRDEEEIRQLNAVLEQRVAERTAALRESLENLKRVQKQLVESEKMAALGTLVAGVAHEINTPLGIGVTAASYLEQQTEMFAEQYAANTLKRSDLEQYVNTARESAAILLANLNRAAHLIKSFKQVAVDQSSEGKRRFQLKNYLEDILLSLRPYLKKTRHTVTVTCPERLELTSYPGAFSQIFSNLIMNSLIHGFDHQFQGAITIDATIEQTLLRIRYRDNGSGIAAEYLPKIFDPFFTTKRTQNSTGLGLYIVYNLVTQQLRGAIACESAAGQGVTFALDIPLLEDRHDNDW